jgi:hypothetical protein
VQQRRWAVAKNLNQIDLWRLLGKREQLSKR